MHPRRYLSVAGLLLLAWACAPAVSNTTGDRPETPAGVMEALFSALEAGDARRAALLFDSVATERFHRGLKIQAAHFQALGLREQAPMPGVLSHDEIDRLSARDVLERYLSTLAPAHPSGRVGEAPTGASGTVERTPRWRHERTVLGQVLEADTLAHVLFRTQGFMDGVQLPAEPVQALTLVRRAEGWRIQEGYLTSPGLGFFSQMLRSAELAAPP